MKTRPNDILDLSKIESRQIDFEFINFDLQVILKEATDLVHDQIEQKKLTLIVYYAPNLPLNIISAPTKLKQILYNLIANAIKFTEQGYIFISVTAESYTNQQAIIKIEVTDTGIGIDSTKFSFLFKKFSQIDTSITKKYGGTGLGLAICKQLIEHLGGQIHVKSQQGQGSTFWFRLPVKIEEQEEKVGSSEVETSFKGLKVLLIEPHSIHREVLEGYPKQLNLITQSVNSSGEALKSLQKELPFDIVLLDSQIDLIKQIKHNMANTKIISLSSTYQAKTSKDNEWVNAYLIKPVYPTDLFQVVISALYSKIKT